MAKGKKTGGRTKGVPNAITQDVREAIAVFAERNVGQLEAWLKRVARYDPGKAADIFLSHRVPHSEAQPHRGHRGREAHGRSRPAGNHPAAVRADRERA